jgi:tetratricopeptide (TPR) repeat protein
MTNPIFVRPSPKRREPNLSANKGSISSEGTNFVDVLEDALNHFQEVEWLGKLSPLASPYFLGDLLGGLQHDNPVARGRILQRLLIEAAEQIQAGPYTERYQIILRDYYFQDQTVEIVADRIGLGRNSFHLSRNAAIACLANTVIVRINPALRLESPPAIPALLERNQQIEQCLPALQACQTVAITGGGGVGKTTLGSKLALLASEQTQNPIFWFTIRPGLNDQLEPFLFALGYFLHIHHSSTLWLELVATSQQPKLDRLLGVAMYALRQVQPSLPILCIDEVDLLRPSEEGRHVPLLRFWESLRGGVPLILIGQQPIVDADLFCLLAGLSESASQEMLIHADIQLSQQQLHALYTATQGNPRLLELWIALYQDEFHPLPSPAAKATNLSWVEESINDLSRQPSVEFLLSRILQRLSDTERNLLMQLSVFRRPAPIDALQLLIDGAMLQRLAVRHLIMLERTGSAALLTVYRNAIYQSLPEERRQLLHKHASSVRIRYGDYAAALYHLVRSNAPEAAIWLWHEHRYEAINQGQAQSVLELLGALRNTTLSALARETLEFLTAELERLTGNAARALETIHSVLWKTPILAIDAQHLQGMIANDRSEFEQAEAAFQRGLAIAERTVEARLMHLHRGLAWRHLRELEIQKATYEAERARYELEQLLGDLQSEMCNYTAAEAHYQSALDVAKRNKHTEGIAKTSVSLAGNLVLQGKYAEGKATLRQAESAYRQVGKVVQLASLQINWAVAYNLAGEYDQALAVAQKGLRQLEVLGDVPGYQRALFRQAMAEAQLGLGDLNAATESIEEVVASEEISVMADAYCTMGEILHQRGELREAVRFLRSAIELANENENRFLAAYTWRSLGKTLMAQDKYEEAQQAWQTAITLFCDIALPNEVEKTQQYLQPQSITG